MSRNLRVCCAKELNLERKGSNLGSLLRGMNLYLQLERPWTVYRCVILLMELSRCLHCVLYVRTYCHSATRTGNITGGG